MSLSAWLRDYLYIPLGGSRGTAFQTYVNLSTVFLLCGLWHGASWTFVIWGAYHGLFLVLERAGLSRVLDRLPRAVAHLYTVAVAFLGWVWFRADSFSSATSMFKGLAGLHHLGGMSIQLHIRLSPIAVAMLAIAGVLSLWKWNMRDWIARAPASDRLIVAGKSAFMIVVFILCIIGVGSSAYSPFLYYRF